MTEEQIIEKCAEAAHEMNRIYCEAHGDTSQPTWKSAPEWQRSSAINGVAGALAGNTPEQSHESWLAEKAATGWKYGPVKNPETKEHPCFVPYAQLPPEQQHKDHLFLSTVNSMWMALAPMLEPTIQTC
jgi:RyR domain